MFTKGSIFRMFSILLVVLLMSSTASARPLEAPLGTGFTYQGKLTDGGNSFTATCNLKFSLWDGGLTHFANRLGSEITLTGVSVVNGYFTVVLNSGGEFGANAFTGEDRWLKVAVQCGSDPDYTALNPLQQLSATPYAMYAMQSYNADLLDGQHATYYQNASNINSGTLGANYYSAYADLGIEGYLGNAANDLALNNGALQATLNADLLDGLNAINFALTGHNHWGETWSGSGTGLTLSGGATGLSGSGSSTGVYGNGSTGVYGSGASYGVYGISSSTGVYGFGGTGVSGTGSITGVYGYSTDTGGTGISGTGSTGVSGTSSINFGYGVYGSGTGTGGTGVYGSGTGTGGSAGVYGSGSGTYGFGVYGIGYTGVAGYSTTSGGQGIYGQAYGSANTNYAGYFLGNVYIAGSLIATGGKSAAVETQDYGTRALYAVESPEVWFEDFGTGQLINGAAVITIEPVFAETVNLAVDFHVFLTPLGDCALYVKEKSPISFTVRAMGGQTCSITFDYRIVAKRLGYEDIRLAEVTDIEPLPLPKGGTK